MKELLEKWYHKKVHIRLGSLIVAVVVLDVKQTWGKIRFLVSPEVGKGEMWVENLLEL